MAETEESKDSPLRSLSSFKSEIPGVEGLGGINDKDSKSFHQYFDMVINGAAFLSIIVLLVIVICLIVAMELLISLGVVMDDHLKKDSTLRALSATTLAILALFVIEVTVRVVILGTFIRKQKFELFDITVVSVTFIIDLVLLASDAEEHAPGTRAITFLISLRLWRVWGIYHTGVTRAREEAASEVQMEKYARNQAEIQADALQSQCDQQLKEIAHLRDYMRQHSLDPDSPKMGFPPDYRHRYTMSADFDKADTVRVNDRVNSESSLASAIATLESVNQQQGQPADNIHSTTTAAIASSLPSSSSAGPVQLNDLNATPTPSPRAGRDQGHSNAAFEIEIGEEAMERGGGGGGYRLGEGSIPTASTSTSAGGMEGISNPAFEDDTPGAVAVETQEGEGSHGGAGSASPSPSTNNNADDEAQLRYELEEIKKLSDAALLEEMSLASVTQDINGVPTTSL